MSSPSVLSNTSECGVRRFELMRLKAGELAPARADELRDHSGSCAACKKTIEELERDAAEFAARTDVVKESTDVLRRLESDEARASRSALTTWLEQLLRSPRALASVAAVALVVILGAPVLRYQLAGDEPEQSRTRTKGGGVGLEMFVNTGAGAERYSEGIALKEGDQVQFRYRAAGHRHLLVVSVDSRRTISPLYPSYPGTSLEVDPEGVHVLGGSIILDDARGPERVFAFFSDRPIVFAEIQSALAAALTRRDNDPSAIEIGDLDLPALEKVEKATILFRKE